MEKEVRNTIQRATQRMRSLLETEYAEQLEGTFDIFTDGTINERPGPHLDHQKMTVREKLVAAIVHIAARNQDPAEAVATYLREAAFTLLNRLVALKLAEARGFIQECVSRGEQSSGFKEFCGLAPGLAQLADRGYRLYLESLFDELRREVGALFDRRDPSSLLWPRRQVFEELLEALNDSELADVWSEDETIGWIYQYYNDPAERKEMREASAAPRSSREVAVRNQFFTPRYVVEFLTDNTLGRIWYEMTQGHTVLKDQCRYLVRRPREVFLQSATDYHMEPRPQIAAAYSGDFSKLPGSKVVSWDDLQHLALAVNGYTLAPALGLGDCGELANHRLGEFRATGRWIGDASELWCCLFFEQRRWRHFGETPDGEEWQQILALYEALRSELRRDSADLTQEDLLAQPVFIPHRPLKDPRDIRLLDPACGSMHFGLYAYDLLEVIYDEAWEIAHDNDQAWNLGESFKAFTSFVTTFPDKAAFLVDVPRLVIEHNLHGIDIDPRCVQIAGLSIWLRAQRSWQRQELRPQDRPRIRRSNIVCAEPMPGEEDMRREFTAGLKPRVLGQLVDMVFDKMKLAGEAGSLLRIEEEIKDAIAVAGKQWREGPSPEQQLLFTPEMHDPGQKKQRGLRFDVHGVTDERFWERAEDRILQALKVYAEREAGGRTARRRLFAEDAAKGFAFIELCRKRYDAVLMNPPFGDPTRGSKAYLVQAYRGQPFELYASFVERFLTKSDFVGAITSHTFLTYGSLSNYRKRVLMPHGRVHLLADFGLGVMDAAMVRAAAYVLDSKHPTGNGTYFRLVEDEDKHASLKLCLQLLKDRSADQRRFIADQSAFLKTEQCAYAYWAADLLLDRFDPAKSIGEVAADILLGVVTSGNEQFLRLVWEVSPSRIRRDGWAYYCKGGDFQKYFRAPHLVIDWRDEGDHIAASNSSAVRLRDRRQYFRSGLTFPLVNEFGISVSILPANCVFDNGSPSVFPHHPEWQWLLLGLLNSRIAEFFIRCLTSTRHWQVGYVRQVPWPSTSDQACLELSESVRQACRLQRLLFVTDETLQDFGLPRLAMNRVAGSLIQTALLRLAEQDNLLHELLQLDYRIDGICLDLFQLTATQRERVTRIIGPHPMEIHEGTPIVVDQEPMDTDGEPEGLRIHRVTLSHLENTAWRTGTRIEKIIEQRANDSTHLAEEVSDLFSELVSYILGCAFGRWDIRLATGERVMPELRDPLAPLPACSPGRLQNDQWLPIGKDDAERLQAEDRWGYPIEIPWDGILVDDGGHPLDIESRVQQVLSVVWGTLWESIEREACEILGVRSLREHFRKPIGFFADHLKRYSKSRRQAPIYWQVGTPSASYSVWLYYDRFTRDTFYQVLNDFVTPKLQHEERSLLGLAQDASGSPTASQRAEIATQEGFVEELRAFREEVARVAPLWNPNLNDGVLINFAPLWRLIPRHRAWQKDCKECWDKLAAGNYDWAHLAMHLWPERVIPKCATDRSLAIAHGLEERFWAEATNRKWRPNQVSSAEVERLIAERSSPSVKAALNSLLSAPVPGGGVAGRRGRPRGRKTNGGS